MQYQPKKYSVIGLCKSFVSLGRWHALRTFALAQLDWNASRSSRTSTAFGQPIPWWSYSASSFIDQIVPTEASVLEIGSGNSTLWWIARGNEVTALETSEDWARTVRESAGRHSNLELIVNPLTDGDMSALIPADHKFDILHIDHSEDRSQAVRSFLPLLKDTGMIIVDNSDRAEYQQALQELTENGYVRLDFFGIGPINAYCWQTSLFYKEGSLKVLGRPQNFAVVEY